MMKCSIHILEEQDEWVSALGKRSTNEVNLQLVLGQRVLEGIIAKVEDTKSAKKILAKVL